MFLRTVGLAVAASIAAALLLAGAGPAAAAQTMVVQPDGKVVLVGSISPQAGAIARLNPDGSLDPSFGEGGFLIDRRAPSLRALALQPDGRIVAAGVGGFLLTRYLADGSPDPAFAAGGVGGSYEPDQAQFLYGDYGPTGVAIQPGGEIVVAGILQVNGGGATDGWIKRYDSSGTPLETVGHLPLPGGPASAATLTGLLEQSDGSFLATGSTYLGDGVAPRWGLARFVPGSGTDFDPGFGAGAGLVQPAIPSQVRPPTMFSAIAASGEKTLVAGRAAGTFLLVRFNRDGTVDTGFGQNGFVTPPVTGPAAATAGATGAEPDTWASALAALPGGGAILAGGSTQWGKWNFSKTIGSTCSECPQPMLARFDAAGNLDPGFGSGGLRRLSHPDGSVVQGEIEAVVALADGRVLVKGAMSSRSQPRSRPFVARLNPDGSYDPSFGDGGLTTLRFPCTDQSKRDLRRGGCVASAQVGLKMVPRGKRLPALNLRLGSATPWAAVHTATLVFPPGARLRKGFMSKLQVKSSGAAGDLKVWPGRGKDHGVRRSFLLLEKFGDPRRLRLRLGRGAFTVPASPAAGKRRLDFEVGVEFIDSRWGTYAGHQRLVRHLGR